MEVAPGKKALSYTKNQLRAAPGACCLNHVIKNSVDLVGRPCQIHVRQVAGVLRRTLTVRHLKSKRCTHLETKAWAFYIRFARVSSNRNCDTRGFAFRMQTNLMGHRDF